MKDFITKMTCLFLLLMIGTWSLTAQIPVQREDIRDGVPFVPEGNNMANEPTQFSQRLAKAELYDNGPLVTHPGQGAGGADVSAGTSLWGSGCQFSADNWMADDFEVDGTWAIDQIEFFGYQTGSGTTSTMNGVYLAIFDTDPSTAGATPIWGDFTTNIFESTSFINCYRILPTSEGMTSTSRPIMSLIGNTEGLVLEPGTYWLMTTWNGTGTSGPWAPPITISGQPETGNSKQRQAGAWVNIEEDGYPQGLPFKIYGSAGGGGDYPNIEEISLAVSGNDVKINWIPPGTSYAWLDHSSGVYYNAYGSNGATAGTSMEHYSRWSVADLTALEISDQYKLQKVNYYGGTGTAPASFTLKVYQGGSVGTIDPGTLVHEQSITSVASGQWNEITLTTPVSIDPSQELWFGIVSTATGSGTLFPMSVDQSTGDANNNIVKWTSGTWNTLVGLGGGAGENFMLRGFVTDANGKAIVIDKRKLGSRDDEEKPTPLKINVYCNDYLIGCAASNATEFVHKNAVINGGNLEYCVEVVYDAAILEPVCATIDVGDGGIPQQLGCIGTVALNETFEADSPTAAAWTMEYVTGTTQWTQVAYNTGTPTNTPSGTVGKKARMYYNYSGGGRGATTKYVSPVMDLSAANEATLTFWHTQRIWTPDQDQLRVYYKTSATGSWTMLAEYTDNVADWTQRKIVLPELSATYYIAFEGTVNYGYGCQLDDIIVLSDAPALPLPEKPSNLVKTGDQLNWYNVHLNWEMTTTIGIAGYYVYRDGFLLNAAPIDRNTLTYFDVTPGPGTYVYEVQSIDAETGCLSEKATLTVEMLPDPCAAFAITALPYTQGFESSQNILDLCWSQEVMKGHLTWQIVQAGVGVPSTTQTGNRKVRYFYEEQLEQVARLVSPKFNLGGGGGELSFWYTNGKWYLGQDVLRVYYKNSEGGDWILLQEYSEDIMEWTQVTLELPDNTSTYWICFEGNTSQGHGVQLDDIRINGCPRYMAPPLHEGFENAAIPACWTHEATSGAWTYVPAAGGTPATVHGGTYKAFYNTASILPGGTATLSSAPIYITNRAYDYLEFSLWHTNTPYGTLQDVLNVRVKTEEDGAWTQQQALGFGTSNAWVRASYYFPNNLEYFQMQFNGVSGWGDGIQMDDIQIIGCDNITIPFEEQFSDGALPDCWYSEANQTPWKYVTAGTYPNPTGGPHSAGGMLQFNAFSSPYTSGTSGRITTRPIKLSSAADRYVEVSFWMYRDSNGAGSNNEGVNVYVTPTRDVTGATPELFVNRYYAKAPVEATANAWYQYKVVIDKTKFSGTAFVTFEGRSAYGYNIYIDDVEIVDYICDDNPVALPIETSFEGDFPEMCWDLTASSSYTWQQVASSSYPSGISPQDGSMMLTFNSYFASTGNNARLTTRSFITEGKNQYLSFWAYRDATGYLTNADRINVYLTADGNLTGATPIITVNRSISLAPIVAAAGWYQYVVELPCASMTTAKVTFEAVSGYGYASHMDNVKIGDLCIPVQNVVAEGQGDVAPFWTEGYITWEAPMLLTPSLTGYKVYRNGTLIATLGTTVLEYTDDMSSLSPGNYEYCVKATYNNACGESEGLCDAIVLVGPCENIPGPSNVTHVKHADDWYDVDIKWTNPTGDDAFSYVQESGYNSIGAGGAEMIMVARFTPGDLAPYNGKSLSQVKFIPNAAATYTVKVWKGGGDLNPGTEVYSRVLTAAELGDITVNAYGWKTAKITPPVTIDASQEMCFGIVAADYSGYPCGCDFGPITKPGYSNLTGYEGDWYVLPDLNSGLTYNWALTGFVRTMAGNDEVIGYNVYKDGEIMTNPMLGSSVTTYRDRVPGPGTYTYEVSAIYDAFCESAKVETVVNMEQSPCESLWELPIIESFDDFSRFPPWCWELDGGSYPWKHVATGSSPSCQPHSGAGMLQYNCYSYYNGYSGLLISPEFVTNAQPYTLKFWMYRDAGYTSSADRVEVYLSENETITGLTPLLTVNRSTTLAPQVSEAGWYEYRVVLNTANMSKARVIFRGVSGYGNNIYVDDIAIVDEYACDPVNNIVVEQPLEGDVLISWNAPLNEGLTGYRIFRDGIMIANNYQETQIADHVSLGAHEYCIIALFDKEECTESIPVCFFVDVIGQCDPVLSVTAEAIAAHTVQVSWTTTGASGVSGYTVYRDGSQIYHGSDVMITDTDVPAGAHIYSVIVNYDNKPCGMSDAVSASAVKVEYCTPITNLEAVATTESVTLTWEFEGAGFIETALSEGFDNGIPSTWKSVDADGDAFLWEALSGDGNTGGSCVYSESFWFIIALSPDNWLITPQMTLYGVETLEYYIKTQDPSYPSEHYGVFISTTGTNTSDFTLVFEETLTAAESSWTRRTVDLSAYSGQVYIAFRHFNSTDWFQVRLDDVKVEGVWGVPTFDIYRDGVFVANVPETTWVDETELEPGTYQYCVRPVFENCTVESVCLPVVIEECLLGDVTNLSATQDQEEKPKRVDLAWSYSGEPAEFVIQRTDGIDFEEIGRTMELAYPDETVEYNKAYTYFVQAVKEGCTSGAGAYDNVFVVKPVGIENDPDIALNIYPNPASTSVTIAGGNIVEIEIYNAVGQLVDRIMAIEGETVKHVNVAGYEAGAYVFRLISADQKTINKPIMVVR